MKSDQGFTPFDRNGNRTYLTIEERRAFLLAAHSADPYVMTFCMVLAYTGARISEVRNLTLESIDFSLQCIIIKCLKKRNRVVYRAVPVPTDVLLTLDSVHDLRNDYSKKRRKLWTWSRTTAWNKVSKVMAKAGLSGISATSRGLRHTFAVSAVQCGISLNMIQKWMGHADIETTALYANAVGEEEQRIAKKMWSYL
ncbi:tyrosine-type recombinase/integrase [Kordiimonas pumila]|uniref:Tyrosine-type recombinase/integrase n=1 Tax=Kordiimonas pumila TaxID=2161677 RepID=A0ABV7D7W2_9PROT|nr:site-specific integrase [Kordiimonas pumila]